ncbi:MAG: DUF11 domain-containing protein, partial [Chlamydiia bacterium]|nr:DUF11 domain-containing protein [Chlamydiia bacterium]
GGAYVTSRTPASTNALGFDSDLLDINSSNNPGNTLIGNDQTSATFNAGTGGDAYFIFLSSFAIEVYAPDIEVIKTMEYTNGTPIPPNSTVNPLDIIRYKFSIDNNGNDDATVLQIIDELPPNASLVGGSLTAQYANGTPITLTAGTPTATEPIQYIYDATEHKYTFNIENSLATTSSEEFEIYFDIQISNDPYLLQGCSQNLKNISYASYKGTNNTTIVVTNEGSSSGLDSCGGGNGQPTESNINVAGITPVPSTIDVANSCSSETITQADLIAAGFDPSTYKIYTSSITPPNSAEVSLPLTSAGTYYAIKVIDDRYDPVCYATTQINATINQLP